MGVEGAGLGSIEPQLAAPSRRPKVWAILGGAALMQETPFRRYWFARAFSQAAHNALIYAFLILVVQETGTTIHTSLLLLCFIIPPATLGSISGVVSDRLPRGLLLFGGFTLKGLLAFAFVASNQSVWVIYVVSLGLAVVGQLSSPSESAVLAQVAPRERLTAANSMYNLGSALGQLVGVLVLAPLFLKTAGAEALFLVIFFLYLTAAAFVLTVPGLGLLRLPEAQRQVGTRTFQGVRREFAEGWQTLRRDRTAYLSMFMLVLGSTSLLVAVALAPRFSEKVLGVSTENAVYVFAPAAIGIFLGLRLVDWLSRHVSKPLLVTVGFLLVVLCLVTLALVPQAASTLEAMNPLGIFDPGPFGQTAARIMVTLAFASTAGFAYAMVVVAARSLLNERIPVGMQGRVFAAQSVLSNLASIVPLLLAGALADWLGVSPVFIIVAGVVLALALVNVIQTWRTPVPQPV